MFCWKCGHQHAEAAKFCPECGAKQLRPEQIEPESVRAQREQEAERALAQERLSRSQSPLSMEPRHEESISPVTKEPLPTNPLIEEPRAVRESAADLSAPAPTAPRKDAAEVQERVFGTTREPVRSQPRLHGPSLLGLSDDPDLSEDDASYLFDEQPVERSTWRAWALLAVLLLFGLLAYKHWTTVSGAAKSFADKAGKEIAADNARDVAEKKAESDPAAADKKSDATAGGDPVEAAAQAKNPGDPAKSNADGDSAKKDGAADDSKPVESAELEKPESDQTGAKSSAETDAKPSPDRSAEKAAAAPHYDNSEVELAQQYLQGRGVPQSCERGLTLLHSATQKPNPKASIQMGALYASGHCVSQDRAQAYKWFAKAHREDPNNMWIERNLNSLWSNMSPEERARAEK